MKDWKKETEQRVAWIKNIVEQSHAKGIIFGNSGGKDSALVGILCKMACPDTLGIIMPCQSNRNYTIDKVDGENLAQKFGIECQLVDVTPIKEAMMSVLPQVEMPLALANMNPRIRMTVLYAIAQQKGYLVAGTGNRSEITMGYFTKWGDGGCDLNPIADLTCTEALDYLRWLGAPAEITEKAPSAGLWDDQTDEQEMGITYADLDRYILTGEGDEKTKQKVESTRARTVHKRSMPQWYGNIKY